MATASRALQAHEVQIGKKYRVERTFHSGTHATMTGIVTINNDEFLTFAGGYLVDVHPTVVVPTIYIYEVKDN